MQFLLLIAAIALAFDHAHAFFIEAQAEIDQYWLDRTTPAPGPIDQRDCQVWCQGTKSGSCWSWNRPEVDSRCKDYDSVDMHTPKKKAYDGTPCVAYTDDWGVTWSECTLEYASQGQPWCYIEPQWSNNRKECGSKKNWLNCYGQDIIC